MAEVDLLRSLPKTRRNVSSRKTAKSPEIVAEACKFGEAYFDGSREYGYGGYRYDGRWVPVAHDIIDHFGLKPGMRLLDVGCAKGYLVNDLTEACPGLDTVGVDISQYAIDNAHPQIKDRLQVANCTDLPFPDNSFDAVLSINVIHNLDRSGVIRALREMNRVAKGEKIFVQVDSYHTEEERDLFLDWVLTARFHDFPEGWYEVFREADYCGDWAWTVV